MTLHTQTKHLMSQDVINQATEWHIMHGVAFRNADNTAVHCPFSIAPMPLPSKVFQQLLNAVPLLTKLIHYISEDHHYLQSTLSKVAQADPFFARLVALHQQLHGSSEHSKSVLRKPLLLMRTDFMNDVKHGAKVIEFNGIAAGMAPFGQRATEFHAYMNQQWPLAQQQWLPANQTEPAKNKGLTQLAYAICQAAKKIKSAFSAHQSQQATFLMVVQENEDNVYDQHLLEIALQKLGIRTVRRTFKQLSTQLSTGLKQRLILAEVGPIDVVYLRAGYQHSDYYAPAQDQELCCHTFSQTRLFIEQHHVAVNATVSQQLATSKAMQMQLSLMQPHDFTRWGLTLAEGKLVKEVLAETKPINQHTIEWYNTQATKSDWVLKNQGEGGGHCVFAPAISKTLQQLTYQQYSAWTLMQRLYPQPRQALAIRNSKPSLINDLVSEIGLFSAYYDAAPATQQKGYVGYLIRSKPATENEGGIHGAKGILDSLALIPDQPNTT